MIIEIIRIKKKKRIDVGLQQIVGIGKSEAKKLCYKLGYNKAMVNAKLDSESEKLLLKLLSRKKLLEEELRETVKKSIKVKGKIKCYAGIRHEQGLPVRGQRTKNNIKTAKRRNVELLPKNELLSRLTSKERRKAKREEKRTKKKERRKNV